METKETMVQSVEGENGHVLIPCDHVLNGEIAAASVALGENRSVLLCLGCLRPMLGRILADAAMVLGAYVMHHYEARIQRETEKTTDPNLSDLGAEHPAKET